jgi:hypothetical protein
LSEQVAAQPDRWQWRWSGSEPRPVDARLQQWLAQVEAAARGRWRADDASGSTDPAPAIELWRDGVLHSTLQLTADKVRWRAVENAGRPLGAVLQPTALTDLQRALDALVR